MWSLKSDSGRMVGDPEAIPKSGHTCPASDKYQFLQLPLTADFSPNSLILRFASPLR